MKDTLEDSDWISEMGLGKLRSKHSQNEAMQPEDPSELIALSALDALEDADQVWVVHCAESDAELALQLQDFQSVVAQLSYSAAIAPLPVNLKDRLFQRIATEIPESTRDLSSTNTCFSLRDRLEQAKTVEWMPYAPTPGTLVGTLAMDLEAREIQCFVRSWGKATFPAHRHAATEEIVVLEGDLVIGDVRYQAGDRIVSPPDTQHQPKTLTGCLLYLKTSLDDEVLEMD